MAVYDFRMYTLKPGGTPDYMAAVRELALPIRKKYGVKLAGWYYSDVGELNQVVHIWWFQYATNQYFSPLGPFQPQPSSTYGVSHPVLSRKPLL